MPPRKATETGVFVVFLRSLRAWSQAELAKAAGMDERLISRYELGQTIPREPTLERLTQAIGLPFSEAKQVFPVIRRALAAVGHGGGLPPAEVALDAASLSSIVAAAVQSAAAEFPLPLASSSYSAALSPVEARRQAGELWECMKDLPARDWRVLIEGAGEYKNWAFAERLCEESGKAAAADPVRAVELVTLAGRVAELAPGVEGLTAAGLGRKGEAIDILSQVRGEFLSRGIAYDVALASLELAVVLLEDGRVEAVNALARQTVPLFQAQGVHREAMAAVRLFQDAVEKEEATAERVRRLIDKLQEATRST